MPASSDSSEQSLLWVQPERSRSYLVLRKGSVELATFARDQQRPELIRAAVSCCPPEVLPASALARRRRSARAAAADNAQPRRSPTRTRAEWPAPQRRSLLVEEVAGGILETLVTFLGELLAHWH
jgi:hypothetical protein